jgi:hypothetical protein
MLMKVAWLTVVFLLAAATCGAACAATEAAPATNDIAATHASRIAATNAPLWFPVGEELIYKIYWGILPVGITRATTEWIEEDGRRLIAIRYRTVTNKLVEKMYPVNDLVESIVEPVTFTPIRYHKLLSEGKSRSDVVTTFDHARRTAHWENKLKGKSKDYVIESDTRDVVSFMYYVRSLRLNPGEKLQFKVAEEEKLYDVWLNMGKVESVSLPVFHSVHSLEIEPVAAFQGFFLRKGRVWIWMSTDDRRFCTKLVGSVPVASIKALLWGVRGPGDDFWTRATKKSGENYGERDSTDRTDP